MPQLPEIYTEHFDLQSAHYDPEQEDIVIVTETRIPAPPSVGIPASELINAVAEADDDGVIDKGEMFGGAMKALQLGAGFFNPKN